MIACPLICESLESGIFSFGLQEVMGEYPDIRLAYGESDEYSFVFHKATELYGTCLHLLQVMCSLLSQRWIEASLCQARQATGKAGVPCGLAVFSSLCPILAKLPARHSSADDTLI